MLPSAAESIKFCRNEIRELRQRADVALAAGKKKEAAGFLSHIPWWESEVKAAQAKLKDEAKMRKFFDDYAYMFSHPH